jgi:hypothetical protein
MGTVTATTPLVNRFSQSLESLRFVGNLRFDDVTASLAPNELIVAARRCAVVNPSASFDAL